MSTDTPLSRIRYLMVQHDGTFKLIKLIDTGTALHVQTAKREAEGSAPRVFCIYSDNGLPPDLNMSICTSLLNLRYMPQIEQRIAAKQYMRDQLTRSRQLVARAELFTSPPTPGSPQPSKHIENIRFQSIVKKGSP